MPKSKKPLPLPRLLFQAYVFIREGHDWNYCEVTVLKIERKRFTVMRCSDLATALLSNWGSEKRKAQTWTCKAEELW